MPPASLSTLAVMIPGPSTARKITKLVRKRPNRFSFTGSARGLSSMQDQLDDVVGGDHTLKVLLVIHYRECHQVVLVEEVNHGLRIGVGFDKDQWLGDELFQASLGPGQEDPNHRNHPSQSGV